MKLREQVASLELSQRLKALGVERASIFCWSNLGRDHKGNNHWVVLYDPDFVSEGYCAAYTVAELGAMLPQEIDLWGNDSNLVISRQRHEQGWNVEYLSSVEDLSEYGETEADARAKMLLTLLENGYIKPEEMGTK